jgi:hypothetical protein
MRSEQMYPKVNRKNPFTAQLITKRGTLLRDIAPRRNTTVVCGAPATGKSTYVKEHMQPGDVYFDFDEVMADVSGLPMWKRSDAHLAEVLLCRDKFVTDTAEHKGHVWIIVADQNSRFAKLLVENGANIVSCYVDKHTRQQRLSARRMNQ